MRRLTFLLSGLTTLFAGIPSIFAYQVKKNDGGETLRWADEPIEITLDLQDSPPGMAPTQAEEAIQAAFATWSTLLPEPMAIQVEEAPAGQHAGKIGKDGKSVVRWVTSNWDENYEPGALAVTITSSDDDTGRIKEADIAINAEAYKWAIANDPLALCGGAYDLQNVLTHEIGHLLGLSHETDDRTATMYPSSPTCETSKRDLAGDDRAGIAYLYEELGPAPEGGTGLGCALDPARRSPGTAAALETAGLFGGVFLLTRRRRRSR